MNKEQGTSLVPTIITEETFKAVQIKYDLMDVVQSGGKEVVGQLERVITIFEKT